MKFQLESKFKPTGDQPEAIKQLVEGVNNDENNPTGFWTRTGGNPAELKKIITEKIKNTPNIKRVLENTESDNASNEN